VLKLLKIYSWPERIKKSGNCEGTKRLRNQIINGTINNVRRLYMTKACGFLLENPSTFYQLTNPGFISIVNSGR